MELCDYSNIDAMAGYILRDVSKLEFAEVQPPQAAQEMRKAETVAEMTETMLSKINSLADKEVDDQLQN